MRVLIVGGDAAGMSAAAKLKRIDKDCDIVVFEKGQHVSYASCGLPYFAAGYPIEPDDLIQRTAQQFADAGIPVRLRHTVTAVDIDAKIITVQDEESSHIVTEHYDRLLIATGAYPVIPPVPGIASDGVYTLKTVDDGIRLKKALQSNGVEDITIVGGGYIGVEFAEAFHASGKKVRILQRGQMLLSNFDPEISKFAQDELVRLGIELKLSEQLDFIEEKNGRKRLTTNRGHYDTDVVLLAAGVRPATDFLKGSKIQLAKNGAIIVDRQMRTNIKDVYAAGDCAQVYHILKGENTYIPLATTANKCGRLTGENLAGATREFTGTLGCAAIKVGRLELATVGLTLREGEAAGYNCTAKIVRTQTLPGYYRADSTATFKVVYEKQTRRLLGVQGAGSEGVALRIDVFAAAIANCMTTDALGMLDLCYAPPFSTVWDAVHVAANAAK